MEANELRIGNLFKWSELASMGHGIGKITHGQQIMDYIKFKEPIPLTEEWLIRFGFEKTKNKSPEYWNKGFIKLLKWKTNDYVNLSINRSTKIRGIMVNSVHQLQNLYFALTGQELEYK